MLEAETYPGFRPQHHGSTAPLSVSNIRRPVPHGCVLVSRSYRDCNRASLEVWEEPNETGQSYIENLNSPDE